MQNQTRNLLFGIAILFILPLSKVDAQYLLFSWMKVDDTQWFNYLEVEDFWAGIHQEAINSGEMVGWDFWSLQPAGSEQGAQYLVVHVYDSRADMYKQPGNIMKHVKSAYPNLSDEEISAKFKMTVESRDIIWQNYLHVIDRTEGDFELEEGTVAHIGFMKSESGDYEKMESEIFKPLHQKDVDAGRKGSWSIARKELPWGSDTYFSHLTFNMYKDMDQFAAYSPGGGDIQLDSATEIAIQKGLATRDMKSTVLATLIKKLR